MPDLATHLLVPGLWASFKRRYRHWPLLLLGNILPDLFGRSFNYLLIRVSPYVTEATAPFHSLLVVPLYAYAVALLFETRVRTSAFRLLAAGAYMHLALDSFQTHVGCGNMLLYPLYAGTLEIPLFWPEQSLYAVPFLAVAVVGVLFVRRYRGKEKRICRNDR